MTLERRSYTYLDVPAHELQTVINSIKECDTFELLGITANTLPRIDEILVDSKDDYTIVFSERSLDWISERITNLHAELKVSQILYEQYNKRMREDQELREQLRRDEDEAHERLLSDWNSRSRWHKFWNEEPPRYPFRSHVGMAFLWPDDYELRASLAKIEKMRRELGREES